MGHGNYIPSSVDVRPGTVFVKGVVEETLSGGAARHYVVEAGASLYVVCTVLPGKSSSFDIEVDIVGEGASVELFGAYLTGGSEDVSFNIIMHHRVGHSCSRQLFKGIAGGKSKVRFDGRIIVAPDAQQIEAYQENHNIVLSEDARVETKPQLEIYADDVKCSHGATVGKLSEEEQFYMRSRGIPESEAKVLQMISFLSPVLSRLEESGRDVFEREVRSLA